jgi:hypothetical protein
MNETATIESFNAIDISKFKIYNAKNGKITEVENERI